MSSPVPGRTKSSRMLLFLLFVTFMVTHAPDALLANTQEVSSTAQGDPFEKGLVALKESRFDAALEDLTIAERNHPNDARVHNFRGIALTGLRRTAEAATEYREAIRLEPRMQDAYRNLGFLEWTEHHLEPAAMDLAHAVELSPDDSFAHYYLGRVHLESLRYKEALAELDRSHMPLPVDAGFLIELATA